jgi:hypothetical protein
MCDLLQKPHCRWRQFTQSHDFRRVPDTPPALLICSRNLWAGTAFSFRIEGGDRDMPTASRKQATKSAPTQKSSRLARDARHLRRATRRERASAEQPEADDILADHGFHAPPREEIRSEELEIDAQLDESETAEP